MQFIINLTAYLASWAFPAPVEKLPVGAPIVTLDYATIVGSSLLGIDSFNGIPYAQPPVGKLRLKPPRPITSNLGIVPAIGTPKACPQFASSTNTSSLPWDVLAELANTPLFQVVSNAGEDCLTINVQRPSSANSTSKLPVVFWIYGGGFEVGSTSTYDASNLISTSVALGKDIIYVSVNYRIGGFGFLPGSEIKNDASANIGLLDQRLGLKWVADHIEQFGGDPSKVTIWGQSAGSVSVFHQMALYKGDHMYKGKPLFRAALMESGSIAPVDPVDGIKGQQVYDRVVDAAGCSGEADTLECLRGVNYETYLNAANSVSGALSYTSVALSYVPRPDYISLFQSPEILAKNGFYAKVPFIVGDQEDEGTMFALAQSNISTTAQLVDYLKTIFFYNATVAQIQQLVDTYPDNPSAGSPFNTGEMNHIYPQYKRIAALLGDLAFTLSRRIFLDITFKVNPSVPSWSYLASYEYGTPIMGTYHASDIPKAYGISQDFPSYTIQNYYISFFNTMDPNEGTKGEIAWPKWSEGKELLHFLKERNELLKDDFRSQSYEFIAKNAEAFHI